MGQMTSLQSSEEFSLGDLEREIDRISTERSLISPHLEQVLEIVLSTHHLQDFHFGGVDVKIPSGVYSGRYPVELTNLLSLRRISRYFNNLVLDLLRRNILKTHSNPKPIIDFNVEVLRHAASQDVVVARAAKNFFVDISTSIPPDTITTATELVEYIIATSSHPLLKDIVVKLKDPIIDALVHDNLVQNEYIKIKFERKEGEVVTALHDIQSVCISEEIGKMMTVMNGNKDCLQALKIFCLVSAAQPNAERKIVTVSSSAGSESLSVAHAIIVEDIKRKHWYVPIGGSSAWLVIQASDISCVRGGGIQ
jgi:hypothetical protein